MTAPCERAPAPVPVESLARVTLHAIAADLDNEQFPDWLRPDWLREHAADYDRMAAALALLATVDVAHLKEINDECVTFASPSPSPEALATLRTVIAAIEAARGTQGGTSHAD